MMIGGANFARGPFERAAFAMGLFSARGARISLLLLRQRMQAAQVEDKDWRFVMVPKLAREKRGATRGEKFQCAPCNGKESNARARSKGSPRRSSRGERKKCCKRGNLLEAMATEEDLERREKKTMRSEKPEPPRFFFVWQLFLF